MYWSKLHSKILKDAIEKILGGPLIGSMAYVRCLSSDVLKKLAGDNNFVPEGWEVYRVADVSDQSLRTITADEAVELREAKKTPVILLVDTSLAGAGMDGIYSAALEIKEADFFKEALRLAKNQITKTLTRQERLYAEKALKKAKKYRYRSRISYWTEYDFVIRTCESKRHPGEFLFLIGLWPVLHEDVSTEDEIDLSRIFVDRLLGSDLAGLTPIQRIETLKLLEPTKEQKNGLEKFIRFASAKPLLAALAELENKQYLWVNSLKIEASISEIQSIEITSWRTRTGKIAKWSGLMDAKEPEAPPELILDPDAENNRNYSKLEVRWKARPENLEKGAVQYHIAILTDMDEELASRDLIHSGKKDEKCRFSNDDFSELSEDALISVKVRISVIGSDFIEPQDTEEFLIRFGNPPAKQTGGVGKKVRTFSEGLIELKDRELITEIVSNPASSFSTSKDYLLLRTPKKRKNFRVHQPALIADVEQKWFEKDGKIGRWRIKVRAAGMRAGAIEFIPIHPRSSYEVSSELWKRLEKASQRMATRYRESGGGIGQIYDQDSKPFENIIKEYLLAWLKILQEGDPYLALANTIEVQTLSGRTIGLIVTPSHPVRVAWQTAYDNLVFHAAFEQKISSQDIRKEFAVLDGAMFPSFLPGLQNDSCFVFADVLGFHAVAMVPDNEKEPKAAVAILATALGDSNTVDIVPTVGRQSAEILGNEILKYIQCHKTSSILKIHAIRPGDGLTVAKSLGYVLDRFNKDDFEKIDSTRNLFEEPLFVLELFPSKSKRGMAGGFLADVSKKRRSGAGSVSKEDIWMLESVSLPNGLNIPRLRWAKKDLENPKTSAHLAIAFDTFESSVVSRPCDKNLPAKPFYAFGLLSFYERFFSDTPLPKWRSIPLRSDEGEKHPSERAHTERLWRLQQAIHRCVAVSMGNSTECIELQTEISPDKGENLKNLHKLCDWVITLDRNAGIEYFDSPRHNREIYDAYVIDCVPEREDLGCLQLITSTSKLEEVRNLIDSALIQMSLSQSRRNAEFLMENLKALSGRLAIRLTGHTAPTSELIALALSHAHCKRSAEDNPCWFSLENGFFIPVDDIRDLLPPTKDKSDAFRNLGTRPDLIYVTKYSNRGLSFHFVEIKYRRHLHTASSSQVIIKVAEQIQSLKNRWMKWYSADVSSCLRAVRRAKLSRVLRFYADKAHRHYLPDEIFKEFTAEIDRLIERGGNYKFWENPLGDRGWIFCPEYKGVRPRKICNYNNAEIFIFGPILLPDSEIPQKEVYHTNSAEFERFQLENKDQEDSAPGESKNTVADLTQDKSKDEEVASKALSLLDKTPKEKTQINDPQISLGTDILTGNEIVWPLTIKGNPHLLMAGLPGMGKTTALLNICVQMLEADVYPIIFSYHQDIDQKLQGIVNSVRFVDFRGLGFNPLSVIDSASSMAYLDVAGALRDIFMAIFPELGDIQGERIRKAIKQSFIEKGWDNPSTDISVLEVPAFGRFVQILREDPKPDRGLKSLLGRLEELDDYGFFDVNDQRGTLWESEQPVIIRIHKTQNENLQRAFASLIFYGLYKDMFRRGIQDRISHAVIFDEAHRAAKLNLIPTMAKECRKYGISLILASQEAKDFNTSLFSAIANYLVLRLTEIDAKVLVRNVASSDQARTLIDRIKQMDRFKALFFSESRKKPVRLALLPPRIK